MFDFTSPFWNWFITVTVVLSFVGIVWLIRWMSVRKQLPPGAPVEATGHVWDGDLQELNNPLPGWWLGLFYLTLVFGVIYLLLYPGLGTYRGLLHETMAGHYADEVKAADAQYGPLFAQYQKIAIPALAHDERAVNAGRRLFLTYCIACHGSDAGGGPGFPNLRDQDWLYGGAPEQIETTINDGRNGVMPAWIDVLGKEGVATVAVYVRSLSGHAIDNVTATKGKAIFDQNCAACHGADAKGTAAVGAPNLTDRTWLYGGSLSTVMRSIAQGRQGHMPAHREFLGEAKVHLLATYVYSLSQQQESR